MARPQSSERLRVLEFWGLGCGLSGLEFKGLGCERFRAYLLKHLHRNETSNVMGQRRDELDLPGPGEVPDCRQALNPKP